MMNSVSYLPSLPVEITEVYSLLNQIGITANYHGYFHTAWAVYLAAQQPERLSLVTKRLYPEVAKRCGTNWNCVERNIRTVAGVAWSNNRELLESWACHSLPRRPKASEFLAILATHLLSEKTS